MWDVDAGSLFFAPGWNKMYLSACVLVGALMCFFGYRAFKVVLGIFGVLIGGYAAACVGYQSVEANRMLVALVCGLAGGILGGVLMVAIYLLAVFVVGATLGVVLGALATAQASGDVRLLVIAVLAPLGGFLALFVQRAIIITATALNGAALVVAGLWMIVSDVPPVRVWAMSQPPNTTKYMLVGLWAILGCLGIWGQFSAEPEGAAKKGEA